MTREALERNMSHSAFVPRPLFATATHAKESEGESRTGAREGSDASRGQEALLALKARYVALTGEEYRSKSGKRKGGADDATAAASIAARRPKQPKLAKAQMRGGGDGSEAKPDPMALPPGPSGAHMAAACSALRVCARSCARTRPRQATAQVAQAACRARTYRRLQPRTHR